MPTKIEWTDETINRVTGCTPISAGCAHCYAARMAKRFHGRNGYPEENPFKPGNIRPDAWKDVFGWRKPRMVFLSSMGDLFHKDVPSCEIQLELDLCAQFSQHTFQILTKRPERCSNFHYPDNVWLGTTLENSSVYGRVKELSKTDSTVKFLSCEPLLSELLFVPLGLVDWVIVGAETGPGARPMNLDWARRIRDDCKAARVPFFFKKDSDRRGTLDGMTYHEFPEVRHA
jgi:protein gp37